MCMLKQYVGTNLPLLSRTAILELPGHTQLWTDFFRVRIFSAASEQVEALKDSYVTVGSVNAHSIKSCGNVRFFYFAGAGFKEMMFSTVKS